MLHRGLICSHSPYFQKAFQGNFRESEEKVIYLPDVTISTLRIFQHWLYSQVARAELEHSFQDARRARSGDGKVQRPECNVSESGQSTPSKEELLEEFEAELYRLGETKAAWVTTDGMGDC